MTPEQIESAREFHKEQGWEDGPKDEAIDCLLADYECLIAALGELEKRWRKDGNGHHYQTYNREFGKALLACADELATLLRGSDG